MPSSISDFEDDEIFFLDPPVEQSFNHAQRPTRHHTPAPQRYPTRDSNAGQVSYAPAGSGPTAVAWPPVSARRPRHSPSPPRPRHYPAEHNMSRQHPFFGQTKRGPPSPSSSERKRQALSTDPSPSRHVQVKTFPDAATSPPGRASEGKGQPTLRAPERFRPPQEKTHNGGLVKQEYGTSFGVPPFRRVNGDGSYITKRGVYVSPIVARFRAKSASPKPPPLVPTEPVLCPKPPPPIAAKPALQREQPPPPPPSVPVEPVLCPEQANLVELICSGRNVFYTGSAGCGKSTVLKAFTKRLKDIGKKVHVIAPTGCAAIQVNGSTTWTYAGWTPQSHALPLAVLEEKAHLRKNWKRFKNTDVLVIDEISMVENLHFERLNRILQSALNNRKAFGGIQIVVTGDFCQLPPVNPFKECMECGKELMKKPFIRDDSKQTYTCRNPRHPAVWRDEEKWAFASDAWHQCDFAHVNLKQIHRQSDREFIQILNKCRIGEALTQRDKQLLMGHHCQVHNGTKIFAKRDRAAEVNQKEFQKLTSTRYYYWAYDTFTWQQQDKYPDLKKYSIRDAAFNPPRRKPLKELKDHRFDNYVELKKGMLVMLLVNLDLSKGLCNGSQGIVCGFEHYENDKRPKAVKYGKDGEILPSNGPPIYGDYANIKEREIKSFIEGPDVEYRCWPVVRFHNRETRVIYAECSINQLGEDEPYSLLSRTQIPLAPAWAITIHKSQGMTLDRVIVDLSESFAVGQVYVALSRATGLEGLKMEGQERWLDVGVGGNPRVQRFLRGHFGPLNG